ncbi:anti-sigma factor ChrR (cupin superfamily) [Polynucleobacter sphagniphilus]|uniref:cupin domain-containing protein n=1 Tax=Polynucleobacter sphagniphilus TaxID=1743169 RepID=UPI002475BF35|nr:cupin domain-containing protein [Polynucleobacter sphagniphilus]MDH6249345.1 anti-sigma factor ChrR (cupin superfamily) [Polynucleobacter sphagniphilus]
MNINADYSQKVVVNHHELPWIPSPELGIERRMLERCGGEVAKATSIVRYQAGSKFPMHFHEFGEEIFVLDGIFSDESGDYPAGSYIMNPPGSSHAPFSDFGCTLFVKLRHLGPDQESGEVIDTKTADWYQGMVPGLHVMPLMRQGSGSTLVRWAPQTYFNPHRHYGGEEIFVIDGVFEDEHGRYPAGSWIRSPHMSLHQPFSKEGCTIFVKLATYWNDLDQSNFLADF